MDSNQTQGVSEASQLKGGIVSALYLDAEEAAGVFVRGSDSNGAKPLGWVAKKDFSQSDLDHLRNLGWTLILATSQKRKVSLCLQFDGKEGSA